MQTYMADWLEEIYVFVVIFKSTPAVAVWLSEGVQNDLPKNFFSTFLFFRFSTFLLLNFSTFLLFYCYTVILLYGYNVYTVFTMAFCLKGKAMVMGPPV